MVDLNLWFQSYLFKVLIEILGNLQQGTHGASSESREVDVNLTSKGLHEDVNLNGDEFRAYQTQIVEEIGNDSEADILSNWPHKNKYSNTEEFSLNVHFIGTKKSKRTLENYIYSGFDGDRLCI